MFGNEVPKCLKKHLLLRGAQVNAEFLEGNNGRVVWVEIPANMQLGYPAGFCGRGGPLRWYGRGN